MFCYPARVHTCKRLTYSKYNIAILKVTLEYIAIFSPFRTRKKAPAAVVVFEKDS